MNQNLRSPRPDIRLADGRLPPHCRAHRKLLARSRAGAAFFADTPRPTVKATKLRSHGMQCRPTRQLQRAFTLLEMLAVVSLIGIIAGVIVPRLSGQALNAKKKVCHQYRADVNSALDRYWFDNGTFATTLSQIENTANYYPDVIPACPYNGNTYTIDSTTHRVAGHNHL